ncbi:MAG: flagellar basal body-associated FliL family protein [Desulfobacterales bacterium]|nr:flagellar basal body-associated FliL family protein [Desulfobacterales bacterium]
MAEEEKESKQVKESKTDAPETNPKRSAKKWIIIGVVVLFLGGGGYAAWNFLLAERLLGRDTPPTEETGHKTAPASDKEFGIIFEMEPFLVNLLDKQGTRYLKTTIGFEVENNDVKEKMNRRTAQLKDTILLLLSSMSYEDINKPDGKLQLKNKLVMRINQILPDAGVRTVYFTEFVVQ